LAVSAARAARAIIPGQAIQTLLITELALPDRNGLELIQLTHGQVDAALVLTTHDRVPALWLTYQTLGTHGFLSKRTTTAAHLCEAVAAVLATTGTRAADSGTSVPAAARYRRSALAGFASAQASQRPSARGQARLDAAGPPAWLAGRQAAQIDAYTASRERLGGERADELNRLRALTVREYEVARQVSVGRTNREIAHRLGLASKTVSNYLARILRVTGQGNRTALATWLIQHGLVRLPRLDPCARWLSCRGGDRVDCDCPRGLMVGD
jgi:DNA-binding NarL/FixJ family response regulator